MYAVREEELVEQGRAAEEAVQHAREEMQRAEVRSAAAEAAKIELSLRLAAALSEQEVSGDISAVPSASARSVLSLQHRCSNFNCSMQDSDPTAH